MLGGGGRLTRSHTCCWDKINISLMNTESRDASLHNTACDRSTTVSIVADGSHHGGNAFDVSTQSQQHASGDKDHPPIISTECRNAQGNQTSESISVRTLSLNVITWLPSRHSVHTQILRIHDGSIIFTHRCNRSCLSFCFRGHAPGPSSGRSGIT